MSGIHPVQNRCTGYKHILSTDTCVESERRISLLFEAFMEDLATEMTSEVCDPYDMGRAIACMDGVYTSYATLRAAFAMKKK